MKNFIEMKMCTICPIATPAGQVYLALPVSLVECFTFFLLPDRPEEGEYLHTTYYLN
ncbi:MAG: hypothetical protein WKF89_04155 [Chitinophagaceae bacterium]